VHEDHRERSVGRPDLVDRQQDAVVGRDQRRPVGRVGARSQRVGGAQVRRRPGAAGRAELTGLHPARGGLGDVQTDRGPARGEGDDGAEDADVAGAVRMRGRSRAAGHQTAPAEPT
jgi:hypothetical protein